MKLGGLTGAPALPPPLKHYDGNADTDWWYTAAAASLDSNRVPLAELDARFDNHVLSAGPGRFLLSLALGGAPIQVAGSSVRLRATAGPASAPAESATTPGHTPAENLDRALQSFETLAGGELCANLAAESLAEAPLPQSLQRGGSIGCSEGFDASNKLLDLFVSGCSVFGGFVPVIAATQPDQFDAAAPVAGAGAPYRFTLSGTHVTGCRDRSGASVDLTACEAAAAYSAFLTFAADRVIFK